MILHYLGQSTEITYNWTDEDDVAIVPTSVTLVITNPRLATPTVISTTLTNLTLTLAPDVALSVGNYNYVVTGTESSGFKTILAAGLLRVRYP